MCKARAWGKAQTCMLIRIRKDTREEISFEDFYKTRSTIFVQKHSPAAHNPKLFKTHHQTASWPPGKVVGWERLPADIDPILQNFHFMFSVRAWKLCRMILLRFWTSNFLMSLLEKRKPIIFMVSGPGGRDRDSQNQLFLILEAPRYF